jgi:Protein of unknown function (DUF2934)
MPREKRAQVTTTEAPAKPAASTPAVRITPKNGNGHSKEAFDIESAIRARAFELYEKRGRQDGHAQSDWFQAEAELRSRDWRTA